MDGGAWWVAVHGVAKSRTWLSDFTFTFYFHALEKEMATHSSVLAWRIPGMVGPGGLPSMGSHRVGHDWSDLAAAAAADGVTRCLYSKDILSLIVMECVEEFDWVPEISISPSVSSTMSSSLNYSFLLPLTLVHILQKSNILKIIFVYICCSVTKLVLCFMLNESEDQGI